MFLVGAEPDCTPLTSHLPFLLSFSPFHPSHCLTVSLSLCLSPTLSLSVSDRVCYMSRLPACSVPTSPSSGDVVSSPLSPGNRRVRSPPRGAGVGREGEEREETSRFFFSLLIFLFPNSESSKKNHALTHCLQLMLPSLRNGMMIISDLCIN